MKKGQGRIVMTAMMLILVVYWLGLLGRPAPRFSGSWVGGLFGISAAALMTVPLIYSLCKRVKGLKRWITRHLSMGTFLSIHVYAGLAGAILALIHTGHRFESILGIALTTIMVVVVLSGFTGRYLVSQISQEISEKKKLRSDLKTAYLQLREEYAQCPERIVPAHGDFSLTVAYATRFFIAAGREERQRCDLLVRLTGLVDSLSDVEYAIRVHESFRFWFSRWLKAHLVLSAFFYLLLASHIVAGLYFGLRWFS